MKHFLTLSAAVMLIASPALAECELSGLWSLNFPNGTVCTASISNEGRTILRGNCPIARNEPITGYLRRGKECTFSGKIGSKTLKGAISGAVMVGQGFNGFKEYRP